MNIHQLSQAARGKAFRRSNAGGPLTVTIDHAAGTLFGFGKKIVGGAGTLFNYSGAEGAGELAATGEVPVATIKAAGTLGSFTMIALGIWLFYRGVTSSKRWNLQTVAGFFMFSSGLGSLRNYTDAEGTAVGWATIAGGQYVKNK